MAENRPGGPEFLHNPQVRVGLEHLNADMQDAALRENTAVGAARYVMGRLLTLEGDNPLRPSTEDLFERAGEISGTDARAAHRAFCEMWAAGTATIDRNIDIVPAKPRSER